MLTIKKKFRRMVLMRLKFLLYIFILISFVNPVYCAEEASGDSLWTRATNHLKNIWDDGNMQLVLPVHTWHSTWRYDHDKIKEYNENPWGIGIGKYIEPTPDRRYGLLALTFQDSFNKPEPSVWYSWQILWRKGKDFRPSLGFVAGLTCRENYHWIPVPGAAPTFGFDYKSFSVESLYVPGFDVLFTWLTWRF